MLLLSHWDLPYDLCILTHFAGCNGATEAAEWQINVFQGERWKYSTVLKPASKIRAADMEHRKQVAVFLTRRIKTAPHTNKQQVYAKKKKLLPPSPLKACYSHTHTHTHTPPLAYISRRQLIWPPPPCIYSPLLNTQKLYLPFQNTRGQFCWLNLK